jgi:hypothetical protein
MKMAGIVVTQRQTTQKIKAMVAWITPRREGETYPKDELLISDACGVDSNSEQPIVED